jgi:hypothetical protein
LHGERRAKNKRTAEREAATKEMAAQIQNVVGSAFEGDALVYLMSVYKDPLKPENVRIDAAKAAIRYERPALAPVVQGPERDTVPLHERIEFHEREEQQLIEARKGKVAELEEPGRR